MNKDYKPVVCAYKKCKHPTLDAMSTRYDRAWELPNSGGFVHTHCLVKYAAYQNTLPTIHALKKMFGITHMLTAEAKEENA